MPTYDVVVIGAGAAGLSAGALLAAEGKRVVVLDRSPHLGGRAMAVPDEGFTVNLGGHLIEDGGSGLTKVFEHAGKELVHGEVSNDMPIWDNAKGWTSIRDRYTDRTELKKVIKALVETPYERLDEWDDRSLREWIHQYTDDQGVELEPIYDRDAIEALVRRLFEHERSWQRFFEESGIETLEITYESFAEQHEETILRVLEWLGIELPSGFSVDPPPLRRQADERSEDWWARFTAGRS